MTEEETISSKRIYDGRTVNLRIDTIRSPDGRRHDREVVEHSECVVVVAIDSEGKVLLERQYRHPTKQYLLEIPAGGIDGDESPEEAVRREMQEETGYLPEKIARLGGFYSAPGFCTEYLHLFLATDLVPSKLYAEDTDDITLVSTELDKIPGLIETGEICDAKSIAGLLTYLEYLKSH